MRFHLFGSANMPTCKENTREAMTPLVWNMAKMLKDHGHHVTFYGVEGSDPPCDELVIVVPKTLLAGGYVYNSDIMSVAWQSFINNGRLALRERYQMSDISLISFGNYQHFVAEESHLSCEFLAAYLGIFTQHKVFPSHAWMHYLYGELKLWASPPWSDVVIPHYLDLDDFQMQEKKGDYLLCMGRLTPEKGIDIAINIANQSGLKIVVAGVDMVTQDVPDWFKKLPGNVEFTGYIDAKRRLELLQGARALLHPCRYIEPFGMVLIEALACGTPIIASDWGALPEIIQQGVTGYCCRDMSEFIEAVHNVRHLNPKDCRRAAEEKYSLEAAYKQYLRYFERLSKLLGSGWYETRGIWRGPDIVKRVIKLRRKNQLLYGAEIGVDRGILSNYLLTELPDLELLMVDVWDTFSKDSDYAKSGDLVTLRTQQQRESDLVETLRATEHALVRRHIMPVWSEEAAHNTLDGSLDFVFIDADHSYSGVSNDLQLWAPKVRQGGLLCGHDYMNHPNQQWGVTQAVDEYALKVGQTVQLGADWTWYLDG